MGKNTFMLKKTFSRCTYDWFFLMYERKPQNSVDQLSFNLKEKKEALSKLEAEGCI